MYSFILSDMYHVCAPDGSCGIQLALLYWQLPEHPWGPLFSAADSPTPYLQFQTVGNSIRKQEVLLSVREMISSRTLPGSHVRRSLQLWHDGLSTNNFTPIRQLEDYLELLEVCSLVPEGTNSSLFVELAGTAVDPHHRRIWSALYADRRCPDRHLSFSGTELHMILQEMNRPSVLRAGHFYPFDGPALYLQKFLVSFQNLLDMILPPPPTEVFEPPPGLSDFRTSQPNRFYPRPT